MLIVMAGLPGTGKSTVAERVARTIGAPVISVDPIEAALWRAGIDRDQSTGLAAYVVAETIADALLRLGQSVIVDAVNAVEAARAQWRVLAARHHASLRFIETVCSDRHLHRSRLESRRRDLDGFPATSWDEVMRRSNEYVAWTDERLVIDTVVPLEDCIRAAVRFVSEGSAAPHGTRSE